MAEIKKVAVLGAGIMGSGIAQVSAQGGFQVAMREIEDKFLQLGFGSIKKSLGKMKESGKIAGNEADKILSRIRGTLDLKVAVSDADLVIEAIPEDRNLKR
jgi:3-hydroxyacyl-CoA dehydrogenase